MNTTGGGNMNICIMSRREIARFAMQERSESYGVISISDVGAPPPVIIRDGNGVDAVLSLVFDDVEKGEANCITKQDAEKIVSFVKSLDKSIANLIVQCELGQSRSAGVAAAISVMLNSDDKWVMEDGRYCINPTCYWEILAAIDSPTWKKIFGKLIPGK